MQPTRQTSILLGVLVAVVLGTAYATTHFTTNIMNKPTTREQSRADASGNEEVITLAGGCFWCSEAYLQETKGVLDVVSGYAGGSKETANYLTVGTGNTDHREAVQVTFDPDQVTLDKILDVYWGHIDPTDPNGQFTDIGPQYTTAIYYHSDVQRDAAEASKQRLAKSGLFDKPVATEILPHTSFFPAEEYHQDYYKKSAAHYERYKEGSGRAGFVKETWAKDAALEFLQRGEKANLPRDPGYVYTAKQYTPAEIIERQKLLDKDSYNVLAMDGTEPAFNNEYWDNKHDGIYVDAVTGEPLFSSADKYDSGTGWPSFTKPITDNAVTYEEDRKLLSTRTEVRNEGGHLGHVFDDGPKDEGGKRYCMNSAALTFIPKEDMAQKGYEAWLKLFE